MCTSSLWHALLQLSGTDLTFQLVSRALQCRLGCTNAVVVIVISLHSTAWLDTVPRSVGKNALSPAGNSSGRH